MIQDKAVKILLVEDDPAHAEIVRRNLRHHRVANHIDHVTDGQAALDYLFGADGDPGRLDASPPDLILLDLRLPKVDGLAVLHQIKADPRSRQIPTVVLTTSAAETDMVSAYSNGACSYLVKPIDYDKFAGLMEAFGFYWLAWNRFPDGGAP